jgi:hypothetical protein
VYVGAAAGDDAVSGSDDERVVVPRAQVPDYEGVCCIAQGGVARDEERRGLAAIADRVELNGAWFAVVADSFQRRQRQLLGQA